MHRLLTQRRERSDKLLRAKLLNRRSGALVATLGIFALSACLKIPESGVAVKSVTAALVFGVPPLPEPVAPSSFSGDLDVVEEKGRPSPSSKPPTVNKPPVPPKEPCPKASDQTFPEEEASTSAKGLPKNGLYRWRTTSITTNSQGVTQTSTSDSFKGIGGAEQMSPTFSRFSVGELRVRGDELGLVVNKFEVVQDGGGDDGIFLTSVDEYDNLDDTSPSTFAPEPPIKFLPLPVRAGLTLGEGNAGVDGESLAALSQTGTVEGRKRVDVCGVVIDTWFVNASQEYLAPNGTSYSIDYDYSVATHLGGYIAYEKSFESGTTFEQNIGDLGPFAPLPPNFRN